MPDIVSDMKKIPSREFQKKFRQVTETLKPGDVVQVTKHGEPLVQITRLGRPRTKRPGFAKLVEAHPYTVDQGEALLAHLDEALP